MNCDRVRELLSGYIDGDLGGDLRARVQSHLDRCEPCRRELFDLRESLADLRELPCDDPGDSFNDAVMRQFAGRRQKPQPVSLQFKLAMGLAAAFLILILAIPAYMLNLDALGPGHDVYVLGQETLIPGTEASLRVVVANEDSDDPVSGAKVNLLLEGKGLKTRLLSGRTNRSGSLNSTFRVPENLSGDYMLVATVRSTGSKSTIELPVTLERAAKVLLTTDKPVYQPGQTIHVRALTLLRPSMKPAEGDKVQFAVEDSRQNLVFKKTLTADKWGITSFDFQLGDELNMGEYKITAKLGDTETFKRVTVKRYVLPKFKVTVEPDKTFYKPGETLKGTVTARYFFGKPVAGKVRIGVYVKGAVYEKQTEITGRTDGEGVFSFEAQIPELLAGQPVEQGNGEVRLTVSITDTANHTEETNTSVPVAENPIRIVVIPESGNLASGLENIVYVVTSYADDKPAQTKVTLDFMGETQTAESDALGVSVLQVTPEEKVTTATVSAVDERGAEGHGKFVLDSALGTESIKAAESGAMGLYFGGSLLIRTDKAVYDTGDTARIAVLSTRKSGSVYLDAVLDGQTILTDAGRLEDGKAAFELDLSNDYVGTVTFSAYILTNSGDFVRDTATVLVKPEAGLNVAIEPQKSVFQPGEEARIGFGVTNREGRGVAAAIGVNIVDESVFSAQEQMPGLAALYFALQEEILKPRYQTEFTKPDDRSVQELQGQRVWERQMIHDDLPEWRDPTELISMGSEETIQRAAKVVFALATGPDIPNARYANGIDNKVELVAAKERFIGGSTPGSMLLIIAITLCAVILTMIGCRQHNRLVTLLSVLSLAFVMIVLSAAARGAISTGDTAVRTWYALYIASLGISGACALWSLFVMLRSILGTEKALLAVIFALTIPVVVAPKLLLLPALLLTVLACRKSRIAPIVLGALSIIFMIVPGIGLLLSPVCFMIALTLMLLAEMEWLRAVAILTLWMCFSVLSMMAMSRTTQSVTFDSHLGDSDFFSLDRGAIDPGTPRSLIFDPSTGELINMSGLGNGMGGPGTVRGIDIAAGSAGAPAAAGPMMGMKGRMGGKMGAMPGMSGKMVAKDYNNGSELRIVKTTGPRSTRHLGDTGRYQPARIRHFFPETLYSNPAVITHPSGRGEISFPVADSITDWRISALASSQAGQIGSGNKPLRVFQDFFIDLDLPVGVTQGDLVHVPVAVYNYLPNAQNVTITLKKEPWFELQGSTTKTLKLGSSEVGAVRFPMRFSRLGKHSLTIQGISDTHGDAISKEITVYPNGQEQSAVVNGTISGTDTAAVQIPESAISGASRLYVKIAPGVFSQVIDGLESMLNVPHGCFEQTSSITYPNVLILQYLRATKKSRPEISMKAEQFINIGYQRLLTFEVPHGGFDWFGEGPADTMLTAYGIMEFSDMASVHTVDRKIIERAVNLLRERQHSDGSWDAQRLYTWQQVDGSLPVTAYVTWALCEAGFRESEMVKKATAYLRSQASQARDSYETALLANALVAAGDGSSDAVLDRLAASAKSNDSRAHWTTGRSTLTSGSGGVASTETTALAAYAFLTSRTHGSIAEKALRELVATRNADGGWTTTQATILALKALVAGSKNSITSDAEIRIQVNGRKAEGVRLSGEESEVLHVVDVTHLLAQGKNTVSLQVKGKASPAYQVVAKYYVPWSQVKKPNAGDLKIDVKYGKLKIQGDGTVDVTASVRANKQQVRMAIVDLGIPPGFASLPEDLEALKSNKAITRYEQTPRQLILYMKDIKPNSPVKIRYRLRVLYPVRATVPASRTYDYYNPTTTRSISKPVVIESI